MDNMEEKGTVPQSGNNYKIVGFNLGALVLYSVISAISRGGIIVDAFFIAIHVFVCFILTLTGPRRLQWLLSGALVLVIGFSTCVGILGRYTL